MAGDLNALGVAADAVAQVMVRAMRPATGMGGVPFFTDLGSVRALASRPVCSDRLDKGKEVRDSERLGKHEGSTRLLGLLDEFG